MLLCHICTEISACRDLIRLFLILKTIIRLNEEGCEKEREKKCENKMSNKEFIS